MALQARAEATRRRILESAVELFDEMGYGDTGLADVLQRAGVSKGAFYYHFDSKEAVAEAIIGEYRHRIIEAVGAGADRSAPRLERLIVGTFTAAAAIRSDRTVRIGNQLLQALKQISSVGSRIYSEWTTEFVQDLATAIAPWCPEPAAAHEIAEAVWAGVLGSNLLAEALDEDSFVRLAKTWQLMVRAIMPEGDQAHYADLLEKTAQRYLPTA